MYMHFDILPSVWSESSSGTVVSELKEKHSSVKTEVESEVELDISGDYSSKRSHVKLNEYKFELLKCSSRSIE